MAISQHCVTVSNAEPTLVCGHVFRKQKLSLLVLKAKAFLLVFLHPFARPQRVGLRYGSETEVAKGRSHAVDHDEKQVGFGLRLIVVGFG